MTRRIWAAFVATVFTFGFAAAAVANDPAYLAQYKLYNQALEAGDTAAAADHAKAAWIAAETELGDDRLTAILAYNYGLLIVTADPKNALAPLRRASELADAGLGDLPAEELAKYLAYAEFTNSGGGGRETKRLREALLAFEEAAATTAEDAFMWLQLAYAELNKERYRRAVFAADKSLAAIDATEPSDLVVKPQALLVRGVAALIPFPRTVVDVARAHDDFTTAINLYPPQQDVESFDRTFAQTIAWHSASGAALLSMGKDHSSIDDRTGVALNTNKEYFASAIGRPKDCRTVWERRNPPNFPTDALDKGYIGAVVLVYDISDDGVVTNAKVLAEVPGDTFGEIAARSVARWKIETPPVDHPGCRTNVMTNFHFVIEDTY